MLLVHFLTERAATSNYARRIGGGLQRGGVQPRTQPGDRGRGRDPARFFGDPSIRIIADSPSVTVRRVFRNSRGDRIRRRIRLGRGDETGVNASTVDVVTAGNIVMTPDDYRALLERERTAAQVERERLGGATEHREGGRSVPAP